MAIKIGSNFTFQGQQPNFERDKFATKAAMKAFPETSIDDGHLSYCAEDGNTYQFKSSNTVDAVTGKWRVFKANVDLSAYATKDSVAIDLAKKVDIAAPPPFYIGPKSKNIKILSINIPKVRYRSVYLCFTIVCRDHITDVIVCASTNTVQYSFNITKSSFRPVGYKVAESLYYFFDETNSTIAFYYKATNEDSITAKVTTVGGNDTVIYKIGYEAVDTIPENAILVEDRNYGNKNLFFATPIDTEGDAKFRAIDITDLPDLSSKYGTKIEISTINNNITDLHSSLESTQTDFVDLRNKVNAMPKTVFITQAAYNALKTKDANTIYYING